MEKQFVFGVYQHHLRDDFVSRQDRQSPGCAGYNAKLEYDRRGAEGSEVIGCPLCRRLRSILEAAFLPNFVAVHWAFAIRASCGVAAAMVLALHFGSPLDALAAGMGAAGTAPSSLAGRYRKRLLATLAAAFGMSSAALIAGWAGRGQVAIILAVAGSAYVYGVLSCFSEAAGAVGLQALLATIILGNIGIPSAAIGSVALSVLGGGAIQLLLLALAWPIERRVSTTLPVAAVAQRKGNTTVPPFGAHSLRTALTVALAILIFRLAHIGHGFWIALTAAIVLRPKYSATFAVGIAQLAGTIVGGTSRGSSRC